MGNLNWGKLNPKVSQLKPSLFIVDFSPEEERMKVLCKNWTFYHKFAIIVKPWFPDEALEKQSLDTPPIWVQLPNLPQRMWTSKV